MLQMAPRVKAVLPAILVGLGVLTASDRVAGDRRLPVPDWVVAGEGRGTPAVDETRVYFLSRHHRLVAVERDTGSLLWSASTTTAEQTAVTMGSRVVVGGETVVAGDEDLVAFARATGVFRWRFSPWTGASPGAYLGFASGSAVYAGSQTGSLYAVDIRDGTVIWTKALGRNTTVFAPVDAGEVVVAGFTGFGKPPAGGVIAVDRRTGEERWRHQFPQWATVTSPRGSASEPLVVGPWVLASSQEGVIYAFDLATGHIGWAIPSLGRRPDGRAGVPQDFRPIVRAGPLVVAGSLTGEVVAYELDTRRPRWRRAPVDASVAFGMAVDDETVYVPYLSGHLVGLDVRTGDERWRLGGAAQGLTWTPLPEGKHFYVAGTNVGFLAFPRVPFR